MQTKKKGKLLSIKETSKIIYAPVTKSDIPTEGYKEKSKAYKMNIKCEYLLLQYSYYRVHGLYYFYVQVLRLVPRTPPSTPHCFVHN